MKAKTAAEPAELMQGLVRLAEIAFAGVFSQAFQTAYNLGVFEVLSEGSLSAGDLAARLKIHPAGCRRLMMALVHLGLVEGTSEGFRNTALGDLCSSRSPVNIGAVSNIAPFDRMSEYLPDALRDYRPQWERALGMTAGDAFGALYADPVRLSKFAELMNALSVPQGQLIAEHFDFKPHTCIMDVAGGPGGQAISIGLKFPHLRGMIMDMEPVCVVAREQIEAKGLSGRFTAVAADLINGPYPAGADVILLGHILHDWCDETCAQILRHCAAALPSGGTLLVSESVLANDFSGSAIAHMKDLLMLVANEPDARERSEGEYRSLLGDSGFEVTQVVHLQAVRDLVVARKR